MQPSLQDKQLIDQIKTGNSAAFEELFNRYWEPLFAAAMHRLQSRDLSQDVLQELFVDLWVKRASIQIQSNVKGYLFTALKHRVINKIKSEAVRDRYEKMILEFYEVNELATDRQFSEKALLEELKKQTEKLPERRREIFEMSRFDQLSHKEIGDKLNISPKTVENHINHALKSIRPRLEKIISILLFFI